MRISFSDYQEWLEELAYIRQHGGEEAPEVARLCIEKLPGRDGNGHEYNDIVLCASYIFDDILYELVVSCGQQYVSFNAGDGQKNADSIKDEINSTCGSVGVSVRPGRVSFEL